MGSKLIVTTRVSRRRDYHQTCLPSGFCCLTERVLGKALVDRPSQRKVQDANVVSIFQSDGALDGCNNVRIRARAVAVENFQVDQVYPRRNSNNRTCGSGSVAADDASYVRTVAVAIMGIGPRDKAFAVHHA